MLLCNVTDTDEAKLYATLAGAFPVTLFHASLRLATPSRVRVFGDRSTPFAWRCGSSSRTVWSYFSDVFDGLDGLGF